MKDNTSPRKLSYLSIGLVLCGSLLFVGCVQEKPTVPTPKPTETSSPVPTPSEPTETEDPISPEDETIFEGSTEIVDKYWEEELQLPKPPISDNKEDVEATWYSDQSRTFLIKSEGANVEAVETYVEALEAEGYTEVPREDVFYGDIVYTYENSTQVIEVVISPPGVGDEYFENTTRYKVWAKPTF